MHQNFTYTDLADRYLKGKLSEGERLAFEEKMQQDPLLTSEMSLQQDIYQALGEARKAALKNRLDQVPIHQSPWAPWPGVRTAAVVGTLLLAGVGYYYYVDPSTESTEMAVPRTSSTNSITYPKAYTLDHTSVEDNLKPLVPEDSRNEQLLAETKPSEVADESKAVTRTKSSAPSATRRASSRTSPTIVRPEVVSDFVEDTPSIDYSDFNVPEKQTLQGSSYQEEDVAIEALSDSNYDFHYQFYDNKLYLHGDFHGLPYKIIALNTETDKKLFLEFENAYYRIGEHRKAVPLVAIEDSSLVKSLKKLSRVD